MNWSRSSYLDREGLKMHLGPDTQLRVITFWQLALLSVRIYGNIGSSGVEITASK